MDYHALFLIKLFCSAIIIKYCKCAHHVTPTRPRGKRIDIKVTATARITFVDKKHLKHHHVKPTLPTHIIKKKKKNRRKVISRRASRKVGKKSHHALGRHKRQKQNKELLLNYQKGLYFDSLHLPLTYKAYKAYKANPPLTLTQLKTLRREPRGKRGLDFEGGHDLWRDGIENEIDDDEQDVDDLPVYHDDSY